MKTGQKPETDVEAAAVVLRQFLARPELAGPASRAVLRKLGGRYWKSRAGWEKVSEADRLRLLDKQAELSRTVAELDEARSKLGDLEMAVDAYAESRIRTAKAYAAMAKKAPGFAKRRFLHEQYRKAVRADGRGTVALPF